LAVRWAVEQFNSEKVLFRSGDRLELAVWLRHLVHSRQATPTAGAALFCAVLILVLKFFLSVTLVGLEDLVANVVISQLAVILAPTLLLSLLATRNPRETFLLYWPMPGWKGLLPIGAAAVLAVVIHPLAGLVQSIVIHLYPIDPAVLRAMEHLLQTAPNLPVLILLAALVPAVCEELAFRGFILSGFLRSGRPVRAIFYAALFFGLTHPVLQQAMAACAVGMVIGFLAYRTGSILPAMAFHLVYNAISLSVGFWADREAAAAGLVYPWPVVAGSLVLTALLLIGFWKWSPASGGRAHSPLAAGESQVVTDPLEAFSSSAAAEDNPASVDANPCLKMECKP